MDFKPPILFVLMVSMTAVRSQIQRGPANALKKVGDSVTLECVTVNRNCRQVDWQKVEGLQSPKLVFRNGIGMVNNELYTPQRYSVNSTGGCSLTIRQLEINDSGRFICMLAVDSGEETRSSILVVINVTESCMSNVTSNALDKDDGYSLRCAINIPAKSVEPSNVTLSFHNKIVGETETTDEKQPLTVNTRLTGTARKENITRVCRASFSPNTNAKYDSTTVTLDVCTTRLIVSHPVENVFIAVSRPDPYDNTVTVRCTADGHPPPTFKWTLGKSGAIVDGDTLVITGDAGDEYTCTAANMVKGTPVSRNVLYEVYSHPLPSPAVQSQIREGPTNALKSAGDSVTLECVTVNNNCHMVDWSKVEGLQSPKIVYRHGSGMLNGDTYPTTRYSVNESSGCSLTITQLEIGDSGRFICMQTVVDKDETRTSILVVIDVTESCMSNVTSNALDKDDGYSLRCAINIPDKSVEPSNVILSFHNKIVGETETTNGMQPQTVQTTLTGTAKKENITQRVCRASYIPNTQANDDNTVVILDVCTTQPFTVSFPVERIAVSPPGPYYKGDRVRCTADGHPPPTFKWIHSKSGDVVGNDSLVIMGDVGDNYTCTATNTFKGTKVSKSTPPIEVSPPRSSCESGCIVGIVILVFGVIIIVVAVVVVYFAGWQCGCWVISPCCLPLVNCWNNCICCKRCICEIKGRRNGDKAGVPLNGFTSSVHAVHPTSIGKSCLNVR